MIVRVPSAPIGRVLVRLEVRNIRDVVERFAVQDAPDQVGVSDEVKSNDDAVDRAVRYELSSLGGLDGPVEE